ncbi:hypothetical protein [Oleiagrimonas soli]|uniref:Uncharacterized protein n=1 Tax=Oleiagrimonas soli TaxID=1543381 RepID=A0A099CX27_9GAMM|nr:hypothetical protein [Oleiagrimonas soli]KGI78314.1 hypothetical protein LF63_0108355 [Oleiagrimonas soli]MBB6183194.1 hypothetical protein [Oleiagrimonas soli]
MSDIELDPQRPAPPPPPDRPPAPTPSGDPSSKPPRRGSIAAGIGLAWLIMIAGHLLLTPFGGLAFTPLPEALVGVAAAVCYGKGIPRTGQGLLLGLASLLAVILLLVAACFGMLALGSFH